jgi:hypothetical protein
MNEVSISFGIKTNRKKEWKLISVIASILAQNVDPAKSEILITGDTDFSFLGSEMAARVRCIPDQAAAANGRLAKMMNTLAREAQHPWICLCDDDILFCDGWYDKVCTYLAEHQDAVDVLSFPIRNVDGSRFWDWAIDTGAPQPPFGQASYLIDPRTADPRIYITGGFVLMRREVWLAHQWDEARGFYQGEDSDWSHRVVGAGVRVALCSSAYVIHNDWRYLQIGHFVPRFGDVKEAMKAVNRPIANALFGQYLDETRKALEGLRTFVGHVRWEEVSKLPTEDKAKLAQVIEMLGRVEGSIDELTDAAKKLGEYAV